MPTLTRHATPVSFAIGKCNSANEESNDDDAVHQSKHNLIQNHHMLCYVRMKKSAVHATVSSMVSYSLRRN